MTIIKKFEPDEQKSKGFPKRFIGLGIFFFMILVMIEIWVNNTAVTYGEKFEQLQELQKTLNLENQILENEIAKSASLNSLASQSAQLGFRRVESIQYIR